MYVMMGTKKTCQWIQLKLELVIFYCNILTFFFFYLHMEWGGIIKEFFGAGQTIWKEEDQEKKKTWDLLDLIVGVIKGWGQELG